MGFADRGGSLPGAAVDALAQQVSLAGVPGVLLDHVDQDVADTLAVFVEGHLPTEVRRDGSPGELLGLRATQAGRTHRAATDREPEVGDLYDFG